MNKDKIFVTKAYLPPLEEYVEKIKGIWDSNILTNMGPLHMEFEHKLTDYLEVPYCMAFVNGHMALEMAIQALNIQGEVITTPFTFASTTHAIVRNNLTPVFCDIKLSDYTIDADKIEDLITDKTSAIVPVHVYGHICDVEKIERIAKKHNLKVIYDAAHAFGEKYKGKAIGNFGDSSVFSFHATKSFNSIEGGAIALNDFNYGLELYQLKNFGFVGEDNVNGVGANAKLSEFHAAMGLCNLNHYYNITTGRKRVTKRYREHLSNAAGLKIMQENPEIEENCAYFPVLIDEQEFGKNRDVICKELNKHNIYARRYFYPLTSKFKCYNGEFHNQHTPIAEYVSKNIMTLPLYESLENEDVDRICSIIMEKSKS
ncbi:MAG: DegT/DnrJ/EryC1/StrS family aminotransferase [Suipraeoptans sp.]